MGLQRGKRQPSIGDRVTIGAGAKVLGPDAKTERARPAPMPTWPLE
jgi:serine acetyltransferase